MKISRFTVYYILQEINNYYKSEGAIPGPEQEIDFQTGVETQSVTLKVPTGGMETGGFWLIPLGRPCVSYSTYNIDTYI